MNLGRSAGVQGFGRFLLRYEQDGPENPDVPEKKDSRRRCMREPVKTNHDNVINLLSGQSGGSGKSCSIYPGILFKFPASFEVEDKHQYLQSFSLTIKNSQFTIHNFPPRAVGPSSFSQPPNFPTSHLQSFQPATREVQSTKLKIQNRRNKRLAAAGFVFCFGFRTLDFGFPPEGALLMRN